MNEQTYAITEDILRDIEAQGEKNYSLLVRSLVAEIRRLQGSATTVIEKPVVANDQIQAGDRVRIKSGMYEGEMGTVTVSSKGKSGIRIMPDNPTVAREFPLFKVERIETDTQ